MIGNCLGGAERVGRLLVLEATLLIDDMDSSSEEDEDEDEEEDEEVDDSEESSESEEETRYDHTYARAI